MTYNVFMGALNPTHSLTHFIIHVVVLQYETIMGNSSNTALFTMVYTMDMYSITEFPLTVSLSIPIRCIFIRDLSLQ